MSKNKKAEKDTVNKYPKTAAELITNRQDRVGQKDCQDKLGKGSVHQHCNHSQE